MRNKSIYFYWTFVFILSAHSFSACFFQKKIAKYHIEYTKDDYEKDSSLVNSLKVVDGIIEQSKKSGAFYCSHNVLLVIEQKTKIPSTGVKNVIGTKFTTNDWIKWHEWFINVFRRQ